jgi:hypothetical protein
VNRNAALKLGAFTAVLAAVFGIGLALGAVAGPIDTDADGAHEAPGASPSLLPGLAVSQAGYRLVPEVDTLAPGGATEFAFTILDATGAPVIRFDELHERPLHLIVLSRNLVDYLHLHPQIDAAGRWTVELPALRPGSYRVFTDFQPTGAANLTLGADLAVPGAIDPTEVPQPSATDTVDGYEVTLGGDPSVGERELTFNVRRDGTAVRTDPYLGAAGHLVAIRAGDLAYLHVHPHDDGATAIPFTAEFPSAGTYRLFLDFSHQGQVRTAAFTVDVADATATGSAPAPSEHEEGH